MADEVGGIGVSFTADAGQLRTELQRLEERLRAFDAAHGRKAIQLQASLAMPGNRALADFRRDINRSFTAQGAAGQFTARVHLAPPPAAELNAFRRQLEQTLNSRPVHVKVVGDWGGWGKPPPETVSVRGGGGGGGTPAPAGTTKTIAQRPAVAVAASPAARPPRTSGSAEQKAKTFFRDWSNADLLTEAGAPQTSREFTAMLNLELRRRNMQQGPPTGGARGLTGGMTGAFGYGPPSVRHWGQGPVSAVPSGPAVAAMGRRGQLDLPIRDIYDPYAKRPKARALGIGDLPDLNEERLAQRLRTIMSRATPEAMAAGTGWYQRAGQITQGIGANTGLGRPQIAAATAAFSQQAGWAENVRNAQDFFEAFRRGARTVSEVEREVASIRKNLSFNALGLTGRTQQALDLAQSADPESALAGPKGDRNPKIRAFYRALMGDPTSFTVDRHMAMMMAGSEISGGAGQRVHTPFQRAGQKVAGEMGMSAADLQAIVWTLALGPKFAGADPYQQRVGGARGFAGQDPYQIAMLQQQREAMRHANASKIRPAADQGADSYTRLKPLSDEEVEARNARLGQILGGGGARGYANLPDPYATPYGREMRARAQGEFDTLSSEYGLRGAELRFRRHSAWDESELRRGRPALDAYAFVSGPARGRVSMGGGLFDERTAAAIPSWKEQRLAQARNPNSYLWPYQHEPRVNVGVESGIEGIVRHEIGHLLRERMEAMAQAGLTDFGTGVLEISQRAFNRPPSLRAREDPRGHEAFAEAFAEYTGGGMDRWGIEDLLREARGLLPAYGRAMPRGRRVTPGQMGLPFGVAGGARGFSTGEFAARGESGLPGAPAFSARSGMFGAGGAPGFGGVPAVGWEAGRPDLRASAAAIPGLLHRLAQRPWGGATVDPYSGEQLAATPGRRQGPYVTAVGQTVSLPLESSLEQIAAGIQDVMQLNARQFAAGGKLGFFRDEGKGALDLDVVKVDQTRRGAMRTAEERIASGMPFGGSYNMATGFGAYPRYQNPNLSGRLRIPAGAPGAGRYATPEQIVAASGPLADVAYPEAVRGTEAEPAYMRPRALPGRPGGLENLDVPAIERRRAAQQARLEATEPFEGAGTTMAAEPGRFEPTEAELERMIRANPDLADRLGLGGGGGGRGTPPAPPGGGDLPGGGPGRDVFGTPTPSGVGLPRGFGELQSRFAQDISSFTQAGRLAIQEARTAGQVRAVGTTAASQLSGLLGRGADIARVNQMTGILTKIERLVIDNDKAFANLEKTRAEFGEGSEEFGKVAENIAPVTNEIDRLQKQFNALQPNKFTQMARGMASTIGGTIIGLGIFTAATAGLDAVGAALAPVIDRMTGYAGTARALTNELSDATRANHGFAEETLAAKEAQIGLSAATAEQVNSMMRGRVEGMAANKNLEEQIALFQSALSVRRENAQYGGFDKSLFQTTGGFGPLFGTPSTQELMGRQLSQHLGGALSVGPGRITEEARLGMVGGHGIGRVSALPREDPTGRLLREALGPESAKQARDFRDSVLAVNNALDKGGEKALRFVADTGQIFDAEQAEALRQASLARRAGLTDIANALEQGGGSLRLAGLSGTDAQQILQMQMGAQRWQLGSLTPDPAVLAEAMKKPIAAAIQQIQYQGNLQRETQIPGQMFLSQLATGRFTAQGQRRGPGGSSVITPDIASQFGADTSGLIESQQALNEQVTAGRDALRSMIREADQMARVTGPSSLLGQFDSLTAAAAGTAAQIRDINVASSRMQVNLQVRQINEQIRLTGQALADAQSFISGVASAGPGGGRLGVLQFQARQLEITQAELGFAQQALALAQNQRQINFQRALAGFVTPGQTPEEIAARQREAKLAADFAQKQQDLATRQLDTSQQQFGVGQEIIDVQALRAVENLNNQLGLLREQARVTIQVQINNEQVEALQALLAEQFSAIESVVNEAYGITNTFAAKAAEMTATIGGFMSDHMKTLIEGYSEYLDRINEVTLAHRTGATYRPPGTSGGYFPEGTGGGTRYAGAAAGFFSSVTGPMQMTVGEAGPETVAILRNPRNLTLGPGSMNTGGGVNVNVTVTGNNIGGTQQDAEEFAAIIARRVEETMSRRGSLLGMRSN